MGKLLYFNEDDGKTYDVSRAALEQMIGDARAKAGKTLAESGDANRALDVFAEDMRNIGILIAVYKNRFGDPYPDTPDKA